MTPTCRLAIHHPAGTPLTARPPACSGRPQLLAGGPDIRPQASRPGAGAVREGSVLLQGLATCGSRPSSGRVVKDSSERLVLLPGRLPACITPQEYDANVGARRQYQLADRGLGSRARRSRPQQPPDGGILNTGSRPQQPPDGGILNTGGFRPSGSRFTGGQVRPWITARHVPGTRNWIITAGDQPGQEPAGPAIPSQAGKARSTMPPGSRPRPQPMSVNHRVGDQLFLARTTFRGHDGIEVPKSALTCPLSRRKMRFCCLLFAAADTDD